MYGVQIWPWSKKSRRSIYATILTNLVDFESIMLYTIYILGDDDDDEDAFYVFLPYMGMRPSY